MKLPVKFPAKAFALKSSGAIVIIHPCCMCGKKDASFGEGVQLRGNYGRSLGYWFCEMDGECRKEFRRQFPQYDPKPVSPSIQLKLF